MEYKKSVKEYPNIKPGDGFQGILKMTSPRAPKDAGQIMVRSLSDHRAAQRGEGPANVVTPVVRFVGGGGAGAAARSSARRRRQAEFRAGVLLGLRLNLVF